MKQKIFSAMILTLMILSLVACAPSTSLTGLWKDNRFKEKPLDSIMVLGIAKNSDVGQRFEDLFVEAFQKKGLTAAAAYKIIPESRQLTQENIKEHKEIIKEAALKNHLRVVLIAHLIDVIEEEDDLKGQKSDPEPGSSYHDYGSYTVFVYRGMRNPETTRSVIRQYVRLRTQLYDTASEQLIWSASSQSVESDSVDKIFSELLDVVMDQLMADGFIGSN
ncbi:MAG: DUF4136 domain-containing protein [Desulfobacterales bacterium]|nr:DUF4136 domain-containing protein [Desulfobacterales bacterium]MDX2513171.1 DUF4136 domain-containing protein [Desulfobacterales bacterium]